MFKRVIIEDWHHILPFLAFGLTSAGFLCLVIRALLMKKSESERLSSLPLTDSNRDHE